MEEANSKEARNKNDAGELVDTLNKVIYDVNLLIEKIKSLEGFKKSAEDGLSAVRAEIVDLKADSINHGNMHYPYCFRAFCVLMN